MAGENTYTISVDFGHKFMRRFVLGNAAHSI